jgi:ribosome-associated heat shock protein Hsp15
MLGRGTILSRIIAGLVASLNEDDAEYVTTMNDSEQDSGLPGAYRLDKWLWCTRFYKTRSLATAAIAGGKVHLNGERIKPSHRVRAGDSISVSLQGIVAEFEVLGLPARRGPAAEAQSHYRETPHSAERRERLREQHRLADQSRPRPAERPDKRDRRKLLKLHRDQSSG